MTLLSGHMTQMTVSRQSRSHALNGHVWAENWVLRSGNRGDMNIVRSMADDDVGVDMLISLLQSSQHQHKIRKLRYGELDTSSSVDRGSHPYRTKRRGDRHWVQGIKSGEWASEGLSVKESSFYADQKPLSRWKLRNFEPVGVSISKSGKHFRWILRS